MARLGGLAGGDGDTRRATVLFVECLRLLRAAEVSEPYWALLRTAAPAARDAAHPEAIDEAFRALREDHDVDDSVSTYETELLATLPRSWQVKESVTLLAPDGQANVIASIEPLDEGIALEQYAGIQGDLLQKEFPGFREHAYGEVIALGGRSGMMREFTWAPPDGVEVSQIQLYYVEDGRGYTATATTPASQFPARRVELRQILLAVRLRGQPPARGD